ncbi:hypothetical protein ATCC90586_005205 [Pythium insidiosum]|nr:hypothetical protein ATCC90586_005205 [Pythium insidiosum]
MKSAVNDTSRGSPMLSICSGDVSPVSGTGLTPRPTSTADEAVVDADARSRFMQLLRTGVKQKICEIHRGDAVSNKAAAWQALSWRNANPLAPFFEETVRGRRLQVKQLRQGEVTGFGTGLTVWPAACVLLKHLEHRYSGARDRTLQGQLVVELGSGTGVVGIAAAILGADRVVLTDIQKLLFLLEANASIARETTNGHVHIDVEAFDWSEQPSDRLRHENGRHPDVILISDCILPKLFPLEPLVNAIDRLCGDHTIVLLSFEYRFYEKFDAKQRFWELLIARGFQIEAISEDLYHPEYRAEDIEPPRPASRADMQNAAFTVAPHVLEQAYKAIRTTPPEPKDLEQSEKLQQYMDKNFPTESPENITRRSMILAELRATFREWVKQVCLAKGVPEDIAADAGGQILVSGSYRLGVNEPGADIDTICVAPRHVTREDFFTTLKDIFLKNPKVSNLVAIEGAIVPILTFDYEEINIDLQIAILPRNTIPDNLNILDDNILAGVDTATEKSLNGPRVTELMIKLCKTYDAKLGLEVWNANYGNNSSAGADGSDSATGTKRYGACYFVGFDIDRRKLMGKELNIDNSVFYFIHNDLYRWNKKTPTMDVKISPTVWKNLPECVFEDMGGRSTARNVRKEHMRKKKEEEAAAESTTTTSASQSEDSQKEVASQDTDAASHDAASSTRP